MEDWQRTGYDPPHGGPDPGTWQVHLALKPFEFRPVRDAAPLVLPGEAVDLYEETADDGASEVLLAIRVYASTLEEAAAKASDKYASIRERAGLLPDRPNVVGYLSPWWRQHRTAHLGQEALELRKQGRHELAVVRVQTMCELAVADAIAGLLKDKHPNADPTPLIRRPATLRDRQSKAFLELLTGRRIQDEEWWPRYLEHLKRRHSIVHEGLTVSEDDATASIEAGLALREWLLDVQGAYDEDDAER
jgi:hypothetical protein